MASARRIEKREIKQQNKQYEKNRQMANEMSKRTGTPVPYGSQNKATWRKSTDAQPVSINTLTPQQQEYISQLSPLVLQGLQGLNLPGQQSSFDPIAQQAHANFNENTLPGLAERFASLGSGGSLNSSAFGQSLSSAGAGLDRDLAALKAQHGLQEQGLQSNNLFNLLSAGLRPQFDYGVTPGQNSGIRNVWEGAKGLLGGSLQNYAGTGIGNLLNQGKNQQPQQQNFLPGLAGSGITQNNSSGFANNTQAPFMSQLSTQSLANSGYPNLAGGQNLGYNDVLGSISNGYRGY